MLAGYTSLLRQNIFSDLGLVSKWKMESPATTSIWTQWPHSEFPSLRFTFWIGKGMLIGLISANCLHHYNFHHTNSYTLETCKYYQLVSEGLLAHRRLYTSIMQVFCRIGDYFTLIKIWPRSAVSRSNEIIAIWWLSIDLRKLIVSW